MPEARIKGHKFHYRVSEGVAIIRPEEACNENTTEALATLVNSSIIQSKSLIIDLSHVTYVETPGFRWIMRQFRQLESAGMLLVLAGLPPAVERAFKLLKLDTVVPAAKSVTEAMGILHSMKKAVLVA